MILDVVCVALLWTAVSCRASDTTRIVSVPPRDVILITIDTLRADRVGANGGATGVTPALDALAREGAVFLDATAHAPLTLPSHSSILTGRYPTSHGVHDNRRHRSMNSNHRRNRNRTTWTSTVRCRPN